jgi:hypothetical protein
MLPDAVCSCNTTAGEPVVLHPSPYFRTAWWLNRQAGACLSRGPVGVMCSITHGVNSYCKAGWLAWCLLHLGVAGRCKWL